MLFMPLKWVFFSGTGTAMTLQFELIQQAFIEALTNN
jgi:hypothetical protein